MNQTSFRLTLPNSPGASARKMRAGLKNRNEYSQSVPPEKLWADLLKRQAVSVMSDVTECPSVALPHALARLDALREIIETSLRLFLHETCEGVRSDRQLTTPFTLADYLECLIITRKQHRAPVYVNSRDEQLEKIFRGIDQIAGLISSDPQLVNFLLERGSK